jgi:hypothetical protein
MTALMMATIRRDKFDERHIRLGRRISVAPALPSAGRPLRRSAAYFSVAIYSARFATSVRLSDKLGMFGWGFSSTCASLLALKSGVFASDANGGADRSQGFVQAEGISFAPWAFAAIKALLCAKFLLIGRMFGIGDGLASKHPLILSTLYKSIAFLIVLGLLTVLEEILMGRLHGSRLFIRLPVWVAALCGNLSPLASFCYSS